MADAGIVRNRAKIEATIGNARALLATAASSVSSTRYLATMVPPAPAPLPRDGGRRRDPGHDAGLGRAVDATSERAGSISSARPSSTPSCRASGWSTTTCRAASGIAATCRQWS